MDSQDVDSGSLPAVKSLRSKFEQLAVDTSSQVRRSPTNPSGPNAPDLSSPRLRRASGSTVDLSVPQAHVRTSSSSSDLRVSTKRPPPPPPARMNRPSPSPQNSRSPSPNLIEELGEEEVVRGVLALKSKFESSPGRHSSIRLSTSPRQTEPSKPSLPPRPAKNGDSNLLSVSPQNTEPPSPTNSRPPTPSPHHRPPPPPPVTRSRSPRPSIEPDTNTPSTKSRLTSPVPLSAPISRQNTLKPSNKPAIPPRPPRPVDSPQPMFPDTGRYLNRSPEPPFPDSDSEKANLPPPIAPTISIKRSPSEVVKPPETDPSQLHSPPKAFRSTIPPPPRHRSISVPTNGDSGTPSLKLSPPPPLPTRRGTAGYVEEPAPINLPRIPDRQPTNLAERKPVGTGKLPPPPTRTIALGDKLPPPRRAPSPESEDESCEEDDPKAQAVDNMPDSSTSSRRPPLLSFRDGWSEPKIQVHPHTGIFVTSGSYVAVGHGGQIKIYDLALTDVPVHTLDTRDMGPKESKVTAMEVRPTSVREDRGALLWMGTKDGHLYEIDVRTGHLVAAKHVAHPHPITHIFRYGRSMVTMDEAGKTLIFSPGEDGKDISLVYTQPRVVRTTEKQEFVKLLDGKLWAATRTEHHAHGYHRLPIIRVYDIFNPASASGRSLLPVEHVGAFTSATIIPTEPDFVYAGHEEGYVSVWSLRTDDGFPKCIEVMRVGVSDVLCLEGVNDRLWAGSRNGMISAFDVSQKPWLVTNSWNAHPGLPVLKLCVNWNAIERNGKLCVVSVGRDECLKLWDGLLRLDWIENEIQKSESEFSSLRDLTMLLVSWNCDSARPDSLTSDHASFDFLHDTLTSVDTPDIIAFGFQEVIDLESRKMTAKNVLLGGKKKSEDNGLSDKVTRAYKRWYDRLAAAVRAATPNCPYTCVHTENLVGLFTCIFVKSCEKTRLNDVAVTTVKRGMGGRYGNKGAIVARFVIGDSSICIINCHLAAGQGAVRRRNADAAGVLEEKAVFPASDYSLAYVGGGDGSAVLDHEIVFLHGDLNYRIDHRRDAIIAAVRAGDFASLHQHDQLLREIKYNRGCRLRGFSEGPLAFAPTYKYDPRSNEYDTSEKHRAPAWCDRILWRSRESSRVRLREYRRYEAIVSDHRPISASFDIMIKVVDRNQRERRKGEIEQVWFSTEERLLEFSRDFYVSQMLL